MKFSKMISVVIATGALVIGGALPAYSDDALVAPDADGTNGMNDGRSTVSIADTDYGRVANQAGQVSPLGATICEPNGIGYATSGVTKAGKVTAWAKHVKNDSTSETLTISTENTVTVSANASVNGSLTVGVAIEKIANAALGISSNFGLSGSIASKSTFTRSVTFASKGKWIIWRGVYTGSGTVTKSACNSSGTAITKSTGNAYTFNNATVTGLTNCANSVSDLIEINAKTLCG